jgi:hypothetical protein
MDRVPERLPNTSSRLIAMAASLVGDLDAVRRAIKCSPEDFREYCSGRKQLPYDELDQVINVIVTEQQKIIAKNRELLAAIRAKRQQP